MSSAPERGRGPPAKPVMEGSQRGSSGGARPLQRPSAGPPPRCGEEFERLDDTTLIAKRQIVAEDLQAVAAQGVRLLVNNRPDGEEPGQPSSAEIEAAARAAGLDYHHIPVAGGFPAG